MCLKMEYFTINRLRLSTWVNPSFGVDIVQLNLEEEKSSVDFAERWWSYRASADTIR